MRTRIITAVAALAVFAAVLIAPPIVFTIAIAAVILIMLYECYSATKADTAMKIVGFVSAVLIMLIMSGILRLGDRYVSLLSAVVFIIIMHMVLIIAEHEKKDYRSVVANGFITLYIVFGAGCIWMSKEFFGTSMMLLIFVCAWMTDTCAYFSGRFFGKHKLIPRVSPNKTVEGAVGGVIGAIISCFIYLCISTMITDGVAIETIIKWLPIYIICGVAFGTIGGICSQLGDLTASAIKRDTEIKDFGWIFPGHGGFFDRFDSVIFIAPIIFGMLRIWLQ